MIDATVQQLIDEVVALWIGQGRAFTAYEVSKEVQARLKEKGLQFVRHLEMRDYYAQCRPLLDEVMYGSYDTTVINVGAPEPANLFHPDTYDPKNYKPMPRSGNMAVLPPVVGQAGAVVTGVQLPNMIFTTSTPSAGTVPAKAATAQKSVQTVNQADELWIGSQYLISIDLHPGETIHLIQDGNTVALMKTPPAGANVIKTRIVEQKGNSRFGRQDRENFGFKGNKFSIVADNDRVIISEV